MNSNESAIKEKAGLKERLLINKPDITLNLGGTRCPILGLKSMKALRSLDPGQVIEIATTGAGAGKALKRVSWMTGAEIIAVYEEHGQFKHLLRKE